MGFENKRRVHVDPPFLFRVCDSFLTEDVFADQIEFYIDKTSRAKLLEVGVMEGIWNHCNLKSVIVQLSNSQTDSIQTN